jgi:hypothetical protein
LTTLKAETTTQRVGMVASVTYRQGLQRFAASVAELGIIRRLSLAMGTFHSNVPPVPEMVNIVYNRRLQKSRLKVLSVNNRVCFIARISK